jgi:isocitrate lyase
MKMDRKKPYLQQESLKSHPFGVPEGYFESFPERLRQRIREEESSRIPVRKIGSTTWWVAMAAAILVAALITTSIIQLTTSNKGTDGRYPELAILEQMQVFDDDRYLYDLLEEEDATKLNEDDAFASQAIEYLAINDVEMDLIFE